MNKFIFNKKSKDDFNILFMSFLNKNGYMREDIFNSENSFKLKKYMDEFAKNYSYEKYNNIYKKTI